MSNLMEIIELGVAALITVVLLTYSMVTMSQAKQLLQVNLSNSAAYNAAFSLSELERYDNVPVTGADVYYAAKNYCDLFNVNVQFRGSIFRITSDGANGTVKVYDMNDEDTSYYVEPTALYLAKLNKKSNVYTLTFTKYNASIQSNVNKDVLTESVAAIKDDVRNNIIQSFLNHYANDAAAITYINANYNNLYTYLQQLNDTTQWGLESPSPDVADSYHTAIMTAFKGLESSIDASLNGANYADNSAIAYRNLISSMTGGYVLNVEQDGTIVLAGYTGTKPDDLEIGILPSTGQSGTLAIRKTGLNSLQDLALQNIKFTSPVIISAGTFGLNGHDSSLSSVDFTGITNYAYTEANALINSSSFAGCGDLTITMKENSGVHNNFARLLYNQAGVTLQFDKTYNGFLGASSITFRRG